MTVVLSRVDNRLVHGQVLEAWVPKLDVNILMVVDDGVAGDPLRQSIMEIAVPSRIECHFVHVSEFKETLDNAEGHDRRILVLFSSIKDVRDVLRMGVPLDRINIGNVHYRKGKKRVTSCVSLDEDEMHWLMEIQRRAQVDIQPIPDDQPLRFSDFIAKNGGKPEADKTVWWKKLWGKFNL